MTCSCGQFFSLVTQITKLQNGIVVISNDGIIAIKVGHRTVIGTFLSNGHTNQRFVVLIQNSTRYFVFFFISVFLGLLLTLFLKIYHIVYNGICYIFSIQELMQHRFNRCVFHIQRINWQSGQVVIIKELVLLLCLDFLNGSA